MTITTRRSFSLAILLWSVLFGAAPDATSQTSPSTPKAALEVRIGLTNDPVKARVSAEGGIVVRAPDDGARIWKKRFAAGIYLVSDVEGGPTGLLYRVQVASYAAKDQALEKQREIEELFPAEKTVLVFHPDRRAWRVRVGEFPSREDASALVQRLHDAGYEDLWIGEEGRALTAQRRIRLVDDRWRDFLTKYDRVWIDAARAGALLNVDQRSYRGRLEARVDKAGNLRLINEIDMEEYLRGVVPNEMGPGVYPEIEALKAQTVAARTYIVANLGQFSEDGYDICDSPGCQVYRGAGTEHPVTDRAIEETRGLILTWEGKPINALYTSTCGGHTEDGSLVFHTETGPYLKGVPCYPEAEASSGTVRGRTWGPTVTLEDGSPLLQEIILLERLGVVGPKALANQDLLRPCAPVEAERWTSFALGLIGKKPQGQRLGGDELTLHEFVSYLAQSLGWSERMKLAVNEQDLPYILAFRDGDAVPAEARRAYAILTLEGILQPFPDNTLRPGHHPSRGLVLKTLHRVLEYYEGLGLTRGIYRGSDGGELLLDVKDEITPLKLHPDVALFRSFRDISYPAPEIPLVLGDRLVYHQAIDGSIDVLEVITNQRGVSNDRYSSAFRWEQRYSRDELEERIKKRVDVGRLIDVRPARRGVSGRVIEIKIRGSRGTFTIHGFKIRTALGIRENLFTIDRTLDPKGKVESFIFSGKGWGHGVGLCQVGSYGMALRGRTFEEILGHYYTGASLASSGAIVDTRRVAEDNRATAGSNRSRQH
jgi:stage II sporulation protein D